MNKHIEKLKALHSEAQGMLVESLRADLERVTRELADWKSGACGSIGNPCAAAKKAESREAALALRVEELEKACAKHVGHDHCVTPCDSMRIQDANHSAWLEVKDERDALSLRCADLTKALEAVQEVLCELGWHPDRGLLLGITKVLSDPPYPLG